MVTYVGRQLHLDPSTSLLRYLERKQTRHAHCAEIRKVYGYHDFSDPAWRFRLSRWLYARTWLADERPGHLFDLATHWLRQRKVLLPGATTLTRLISQIRERASVRTWRRLAALPSDEQCAQLEALLEVPDGERRSPFDRLRRSPRRISSAAMRSALQRYRQLRHLGIRGLDFSSIPPGRLKALARYAATGWAPSIARMPDERRRATLVAFAYAYEAETLDDALDLLDLLITDIAASAKRRGVKKRLRTLEDLDKAALELADVCSVLLDEDCPDSEVRTVVFAKLSKEHLPAQLYRRRGLSSAHPHTDQSRRRPPSGDPGHLLRQARRNKEALSPRSGRPTWRARPGDQCGRALEYHLHGGRPESSEGPGRQDPAGGPDATLTPETQAHLCARTLCLHPPRTDCQRRLASPQSG